MQIIRIVNPEIVWGLKLGELMIIWGRSVCNNNMQPGVSQSDELLENNKVGKVSL